jgi:hypothetical protein
MGKENLLNIFEKLKTRKITYIKACELFLEDIEKGINMDVDITNESIGDLITISRQNNEKDAILLIKEQFFVFNKEDLKLEL